MKLLVHAEKSGPRLRYILKLMLGELLGLEYSLEPNRETFQAYTGPRLNYSRKPVDGAYNLQPVALLAESDLFEQEIHVQFHKDIPAFFWSSGPSDLPFDPLAASFYLVSRYEEYLPFIADHHNRFPAKESLAFKHRFLDRPVVNEYADLLAEGLGARFPQLVFNRPEYRFISTVDIDNTYAYLGKGFVRALAGTMKDLAGFRLDRLVERFGAYLGLRKDPYDTFDEQMKRQERLGFSSIYFILFAPFGQFDRNLPIHSKRLQQHIKHVADSTEVAIHPSYRSNENRRQLEKEVRTLGEVLNVEIRKSRQHFLRLRMPYTYRTLLDLDIRHDYSMGYASHPGFRAGICNPFLFYDLEMEQETPLRIHPFVFLETTFLDYLRMGPEEAWLYMEPLMDKVRRHRGELITVWHNRTFSEAETNWKGWNALFERMAGKAVAP